MRPLRLLALAALLAACGGDTEAEETDETVEADPDAPEIVSGTVHCEGESGAQSIVADVVATDPQGIDTLATTGGRFIAADGDEVLMDEEVLLCQSDGTCQVVVVSAMNPGVDCVTAPDLVFTAVVVDVDGHPSEAFELTWLD